MPAPVIAVATSQSSQELPPGEHLLMETLAQAGASAKSVIWSSREIDWQHFDAVLIRTCWDYHLRVEEFLAWIRFLEDRDILVINHPELIRWNADKRYLKQFAAKGIAIPETVWLEPGEEADVGGICAERAWKNAVVKPLVSASAYGTDRLSSGIVRGPRMIQQYLPAIETEGEWSLIYFDQQFSHAVRKRPRASDFRVQKDHGGSVESAAPPLNLMAFAEAALRELPRPATFVRIDIVEQDEKFYMMEMEVIEPELFLDYAEGSANSLAKTILRSCPRNGL